ncbi:MAG TPA: substrate-binding domain-containing protein, partial [Beijerinckiaceae bacterium]|nr:substrate-binding domain-containing protein [Beijerinckiaceae bacterium]
LRDLLLARAGLAEARLSIPATVFATGHDLAVAVRTGEIDCGLATRAAAAANGLGFVPLATEHFDLVMRRRTYFEPGPQKVFAAMRSPEFQARAALFQGYDLADAGAIRFNG